jgi:hypothetical protein
MTAAGLMVAGSPYFATYPRGGRTRGAAAALFLTGSAGLGGHAGVRRTVRVRLPA